MGGSSLPGGALFYIIQVSVVDSAAAGPLLFIPRYGSDSAAGSDLSCLQGKIQQKGICCGYIRGSFRIVPGTLHLWAVIF